MKALIICAVLACASASPLLGSDRCTWGPSYWCSHISHASECGAVGHCIDAVWSKQTLPENQRAGEMCQLCEGVITQVKQMLLDPSTLGMVKKFLDTSCTLLPDAESQRQCTQIVDTYYNEVIQMIKSKLLPHQICAALGLCGNAAFADKTPHQQQPTTTLKFEKQPKAGASVTCEICKIVLTAARDFIRQNSTEAEVITFIKTELCARLGSAEKECDSLIDQYGAMIFELLANELDPETVCRAIGMCTSVSNPTIDLHRVILTQKAIKIMKSPAKQVEKKSQTPVNAKVDVKCVMCEYVMTELDKVVGTNKSRKAVINALDKLCERFPKTIVDECEVFVKQYTPMILQFLAKEIASDELCKLMGLCKSQTANLQTLVKQTPLKASVQCIACEFVMSQLDTLLEKNSTEKQIQAALDKVCSLLPATVTTECKTYVDAYAPVIIQLLLNNYPPEKACQFLGLCAPAKQTPVLQQSTQKVKAGPQCVICEFVMKEVDSLLLKNKTEKEIVAALDKVCSYLPSTISAECTSFVNQYGPMVVKLLIQDLAPSVICSALGLCQNTQIPMKQEMCETCKTVMMYINMLLKEQSTVTTIDHVVEKVCNFLPSTMRSDCVEIIEQYGAAIIAKVDQLINPQQICAEIKLCKAATVFGHVKLLGSEKCTYGPAYWCANAENAKRCQAVEHCSNHVWNK